MPPRANPMAMMQQALAVAHLLELAQLVFAWETLGTLVMVARARAAGYTHRSQITDNPLVREKQRYSHLSPADTATVLGSFLEMATRTIRARLENQDMSKWLWGHIWETNEKDASINGAYFLHQLPLSRGAPTLKAVVEELFDTFAPMVVKNTLNTWDGSEWKAPNVREAEANQQAQQNAALAATAQLLQQMMDNNFANNRALQDGVAGNPVVIPVAAAPPAAAPAASGSNVASNSVHTVSTSSAPAAPAGPVHSEMNLKENLNPRYASSTAATVAAINGVSSSSSVEVGEGGTPAATSSAAAIPTHYIPAGKETATDTNMSNTTAGASSSSSSVNANVLGGATAADPDPATVHTQVEILSADMSQFLSTIPGAGAGDPNASSSSAVQAGKPKGKKGKKGSSKKGAGKANKRQGDVAEKGVDKAAKKDEGQEGA